MLTAIGDRQPRNESPEFFENLRKWRETLPVLPRPTKEPPYGGTYFKCTRCKGIGSARYNRRNGDDYCYLCAGTGWQIKPPKTSS